LNLNHGFFPSPAAQRQRYHTGGAIDATGDYVHNDVVEEIPFPDRVWMIFGLDWFQLSG
jgi:hypothetical protein